MGVIPGILRDPGIPNLKYANTDAFVQEFGDDLFTNIAEPGKSVFMGLPLDLNRLTESEVEIQKRLTDTGIADGLRRVCS